MQRRTIPLNLDNESLVRSHIAFYCFSLSSRTNKIKSKHSITYELCQPVIILGQVLGLISWDFSIRSSNHTERKLFKRALMVLYKAAVKIGIIFIFVHRIKDVFVRSVQLSYVQMLVLNAASWIPISYSCLVLVYYLFDATGPQKLLSLLKQYDKLFEKGIKKRKFQFKNCIVHFVIYFFVWLYWLIFTLTDPRVELHFKPSIIIFHFVQIGFDIFTTVFFVVTINLCAELFSLLNSQLDNNLPSKILAKSQFIDRTCSQYKQLYQLAQCLQSEFSLLISALLGSYAFTLCMRCSQILSSNSFTVSTGGWIFLSVVLIYRIFIVCAAAENISGNARLVVETLNNIDPKCLSQTQFQTVVMLSNKLSLHPVEITAAGKLFRINMSTFTTLMSTILTYLVVLTQFNSPNNTGGLNTNSTMTNKTQ